MMALKSPMPINFHSNNSSASFTPQSAYSVPSWLPAAANQDSDMKSIARNSQSLNSSSTTQQTTPHQDSALSSNTTDSRVDESAEDGKSGQDPSSEPQPRNDAKHGLVSPVGPLKIDIDKSKAYSSATAKEAETPLSVIHAPVGFGKFNKVPSSQKTVSQEPKRLSPTADPKEMGATSIASNESTDSIASNVTVTRVTADDAISPDRMQIPPLQTQLPTAPDWTKTPLAQTRKDLGITSRPPSVVASLASISEAEDDPDQGTEFSTSEFEDVDERPTSAFYRNDEEEFRTLQSALTECWTLCNTLAGLSYIHREKIFSRKGNMQQQAWRSCWRLCQNLYEARDDTVPMDTRLTLDLCREFCQALFDVRAREPEVTDSVLRVSFELNNHLFNTHDRNLPEAFSERTLDFYITLCHRLMKQRSSIIEETGSLLRACWALAEMLFSIRQTRREERRPDEELLSSAIQACWELCDLFRDGWTQIRPDRQTPRPAQTTLTQAFQQARATTSAGPDQPQPKHFLPETPTTIFEDMIGDSPYEPNAPNIFVLGPGESPVSMAPESTNPPSTSQLHPRKSSYQWPTISQNSVTTLSTTSDVSFNSSIRTVRSPSDDPHMALLKSLFIRVAMHTNRGFSPLSTSSNISTSRNSLPVFVKSLPDIAFGSQPWQVSLLDHYRKAIANDPTFRVLGVAANPTLLGLDGDESTREKIRADTARAVQTVVGATFGWTWLKDLFRLEFRVYVEDVLGGDEKK